MVWSTRVWDRREDIPRELLQQRDTGAVHHQLFFLDVQATDTDESDVVPFELWLRKYGTRSVFNPRNDYPNFDVYVGSAYCISKMDIEGVVVYTVMVQVAVKEIKVPGSVVLRDIPQNTLNMYWGFEPYMVWYQSFELDISSVLGKISESWRVDTSLEFPGRNVSGPGLILGPLWVGRMLESIQNTFSRRR